MHPLDGLVRPIVSEKSLLRRESAGQYTFEVDLRLTKDQIAKSLSKMFDVKVASVNTLIKRHRPRRRGAHYTSACLATYGLLKLMSHQL